MTESNLSFAPLPNGLCSEERGEVAWRRKRRGRWRGIRRSSTEGPAPPAEHHITLPGEDERGVCVVMVVKHFDFYRGERLVSFNV